MCEEGPYLSLLFGSEEGKEALLGLLNAVLNHPPEKLLAEVELMDRELDPKYLLDRAARLDILACTLDGTIINIEVQIANRYNIDKRTLFYWAGLYHGQLQSGQDFSRLHKTITINILGFDWFKEDERYQHTFHIREDQSGETLTGDLEMHFLELEKAKQLNRQPQNTLEEWLMLGDVLGLADTIPKTSHKGTVPATLIRPRYSSLTTHTHIILFHQYLIKNTAIHLCPPCQPNYPHGIIPVRK